MNFVQFEKFGFHGYSSGWKLTTVEQTMSDCPGSDRKVTSHNNFKLRLSKSFFDLVRDFLFKFGVILAVWLPGVII